MTDYRRLLEHDLRLAGSAGFSLHDLNRRRIRKRRNQRVGTVALALVVAAAAIGGLIKAFDRVGETPRPADLPDSRGEWSRIRTPPPDGVWTLTPGGPGLVAVGIDGRRPPHAAVWTSKDGRTWTPIEPGLGVGLIWDVTVGGPGLVAVGSEDNEYHSGGDAAIWTSLDGLTWTRAHDVPVARGGHIFTVAPGGPGLVALGADPDGPLAWFSSDGVTWRSGSIPPGGWHRGERWFVIRSVGTSGDRLVAAGDRGRPHGALDQAVLWTSTDGESWADVPLDPRTFPPGSVVSGVVGDVAGFVAVGSVKHGRDVEVTSGDSVIWTSTDGEEEPAIWRSPDGLHWRRVLGPDVRAGSGHPYSWLNSVATNGLAYVAIGGEGRCETPDPDSGRCSTTAVVWTSKDGDAWVRVPTGPAFHGSETSASQVSAWGSRFIIKGTWEGSRAWWISS